MKRRENKLPEWTRIIWASSSAKVLWEPRMQRIGALMAELELLTVEMGFRQAAWIFVTPEELVERTAAFANRGLMLYPLQRVGQFGSYASTGKPYQEGKPWHYRAVVFAAGLKAAGDLAQYFLAGGDNDAIGKLLGYPACCREFFQQVWVEEHWLDTTWPMAERTGVESKQHDHVVFEAGTGTLNPDMRLLRFSGNVRWPANILGRWAGVRAVPWLPCSLACRATVEAWDTHWGPLAVDTDPEAVDWLRTLLQASWKWSALHGIAEIETPIFKVSTRTDACDEVHTVEYVGAHELEAGATGTRFPYHAPQAPQLTKGKSFAAGLEALGMVPLGQEKEDGRLWTQNGFDAHQDMEEAHAVLFHALSQGYTPAGTGYIMDPGCGNGHLLEKIGFSYPNLTCCGIECMRSRAIAAYERLPGREEECVVCGTLGDLDNWRAREYDLVLMMPGRLLELEPPIRNGVLYYLKEHARQLLVYAYNDQKYANLEDYARDAGLLADWCLTYQVEVPGTAMAAIFCKAK